MITIKHKVGNSIKWTITSKDSNGAIIDLTGFSVNVDAYAENSSTPLFSIQSDEVSSVGSVVISTPSSGVVELYIKNTTKFRVGEYICDVQYIDSDGFKSSSNNFRLKILKWI